MAATHYRILGVPKKATKDQIRKAWKKLAFSCHPDRAATRNLSPRGEKGLSRRFKMAKEAYEILRDPDKRKSYDRELVAAAREKKEAAARRKREKARQESAEGQRRKEAARRNEDHLRRQEAHAVETRRQSQERRRRWEEAQRQQHLAQLRQEVELAHYIDEAEWAYIRSEIRQLRAYLAYLHLHS